MDARAIETLLGSPIVGRRAAGGGYTPAERWVLQLADGRSVFVKAAVNELTAGWLRTEHRMYADLRAPFMPEMLGRLDDAGLPALILEDLSGCAWPPPWTDARIRAVLDTFAEVAGTPPPVWLAAEPATPYLADGWRLVAEDPAPLLSTGIVPAAWLDATLPALIDASATATAGDRLCHFDVRSDNLCFRDDGSAVLVDWNLAEVGNPRLDVAFWLPSLVLEGGPQPEQVLPNAGPEAAEVAGFFASRCGLPTIPDARRVRDFQKRQLVVALPWLCRELDLPLP